MSRVSPKEYRLVPASVPLKRGPKTRLYAQILEEFLASEENGARVDLPGKAAATVAVGLRRAIRNSSANARVTVSEESVYLRRLETHSP